MKKVMSVLFGLSLMFPLIALANEATQPDFAMTIMSLMDAIQGKASIAVILVAVFQLLRTAPVVGILSKVSGRYLQVVIAASTALGFVAQAWATSGNLGAAAVEGLFTAGGAMLIYTAIRSIKSAE